MSPAGRLRMDIIRRVVRERRPESLVEVGPGMGAAGWVLAGMAGTYDAYEPDEVAWRVASDRLAPFESARVLNQRLPVEPPSEYDGLVACEVLEHIEDDQLALSEWMRWVRPGGFVLISVPAKQERFGPYDRAVGHHRRYDLAFLRDRLDGAGLVDVEIRSYGMPLGYILEGIRHLLLAKKVASHDSADERTSRSGRTYQPSSKGRLIQVLTLPFILLQRLFERTQWGIGWVAIGRKP